MSSDFMRTKNIGTVDVADRSKPLPTGSNDSLFERDWEELVIRFDQSKHCFEVKTEGGSGNHSNNADFRRAATSERKK
jgi:hypothetical protein